MRIRICITAARLAAVFLVSAAFPLAAADVIGKISYLEGKVEIVRDEGSLDAKTVKEGLALENFDLLKVGADGELEVQIASPSSPPSTLRVGPRTQFSIEIGKVGTKQQTTFDLIAGSVAMKVAKLTGNQTMRVQTEATVVGVRGTDFTVTAPASGDILVTCDEGEVECTDEKGTTLRAGADEAIEKPYGKPLARVALAGAALSQYRRGWLDRQVTVLKRDPLKLTIFNRTLFYLQLKWFNRQFTELWKHRKTFDAWREEDRSGVIGQLIRNLNKPDELTDRLKQMRLTLFKLERTYVRLLELREYCEEQNISGKVGLLQSSTSFFKYLDRQGKKIELRRALVRWLMWQYARRNDGQVPGGPFDPVDWASFFGK